MRTSLADSSDNAEPAPTGGPLLRRGVAALACLLSLAVTVSPVAADALADAGDRLVAASEDRDRVVAEREAAEQRVVATGRVARAADVEWRRFSEAQQQNIRELDLAISNARDNAVLAYMWAGSRGALDDVLDGGVDNSFGVRRHFAVGRVDVAREAAGRLVTLADVADEQQLLLAGETSRLAERASAASADLDRLLAAEREAEQEVADAAEALAKAEQAESDRAAARAEAARAAARAKLPPPSAQGIPSAEQWAKLRNCESTNNYQAVNPSGRYRGAYQFDLRTWQSMGGTGDPAAASPEEQDLRAQMLYDARGRYPWPECGRFLP